MEIRFHKLNTQKCSQIMELLFVDGALLKLHYKHSKIVQSSEIVIGVSDIAM